MLMSLNYLGKIIYKLYKIYTNVCLHFACGWFRSLVISIPMVNYSQKSKPIPRSDLEQS